MPRKPNTEIRRAQIVAALLVCMARLGYEKATIQAIAREAGLAPGLIHYHFHSKQEILLALVKSLADHAGQRLAHTSAGCTGPMAQLRAHITARLGLGEGAAPDVVAAWVMIGAEAVRQPEVHEVYQQAIATELTQLGVLFRACLAERQRDTNVAQPLAAGLLAMMEGAFQLASAAGAVMPVNYAADAAMTYTQMAIESAKPAHA